MTRYPHTTAGSILLLAAAHIFIAASSSHEGPVLLVVSLCFLLGGLRLIWSREEDGDRSG